MSNQPPATPVVRLWRLVQEKKSDITAIYFYAILNGLIQLALPVGIQAIIGFVLGGTLATSLVVLITMIVIAVALVGLLQINQMKIIERIQQRIFVKYSYEFASRIPQLDLKHVDSYHLPELVNRFFDATALQKSLSKLLLDMPTAFIQILFGLMLLSFYHPLFILFGILLLALLWTILRLTGKKGLDSSIKKSTYKYQVAGWFEELARLAKTFKYAASAGLHLNKADEKTINYLEARTVHFKVLLLQYKSLVFFKTAVTAAMLIVGVILLLDQQINIGQFVATEIIIIAIIGAVEKIIVDLDDVYDSLTAIDKLSQLADKPVETGGSLSLDESGGISIRAEKLSFGYQAGQKVLDEIDFRLNPGQKACIDSAEGTGKTTLLKLLIGMYPDFDGMLLLNEIPLRNYDLNSLRSKTGILFPQENIFEGSLWENIALGREGIDIQHVSKLVHLTGLQPFLAQLPSGYDSLLDPTGRKLPRSVINKILFVRALAHQPRLLIMEEPWLNIEPAYRDSIQQYLLQQTDVTMVIVSSDKAFNAKCNQVIDLKQ